MRDKKKSIYTRKHVILRKLSDPTGIVYSPQYCEGQSSGYAKLPPEFRIRQVVYIQYNGAHSNSAKRQPAFLVKPASARAQPTEPSHNRTYAAWTSRYKPPIKARNFPGASLRAGGRRASPRRNTNTEGPKASGIQPLSQRRNPPLKVEPPAGVFPLAAARGDLESGPAPHAESWLFDSPVL